jgi:hypothetical protein
MKTELEDFINNNIDSFYTRTPDPAVLDRIREQMKQVERKKKEKVFVISSRLRWAAAACLILLAGSVAFLAIQRTDNAEGAQTAAVTTKKPATVEQEQTPITDKITDTPIEKEITAENTTETRERKFEVVEEDYTQRNVLLAKLNNSESPSQRLAAASQLDEITSTDHDIVDALANTMNTDPNTNVRLAALDALSKFYRESYVKKKLLSSLSKQKDPMVQIALIELLTKMKEVSIMKQLNKMVKDENTMQPVKDHAYSSMFTLRS